MTCGDDLPLSLYVEGALTGEEAWRVKSHVQHCVRCTRRLEDLGEEDRILAALLAEPVAEPSLVHKLWPWLVVAATFGVARLGLDLLDETWNETVQSLRLHWLDPLGPQVAGDAVFGALFFVTRQAMNVLTSFLLPVAGTLAGVAIVGLVLWSLRKLRIPKTALAMVVAWFVAAQANAMTHRHGETVAVPAGETLHDSLVAAGEAILIDGVVEGDLIAAGGRVVIKGTVKGNLISWSKRLQIDGVVEGSIYCGAKTIDVKGTVMKNAATFAQAVDIPPTAQIGGDVLAFVQDLSVDGSVTRDLWAFSEAPTIGGSIGRNLRVRSDRLLLLSTANVGGDVRARVPSADRLRIDPGASVAGKVDTELPEPKSRKKAILWTLVSLGAALVTGLVLARLSPSLMQAPAGSIASLGLAFGRGALILLAVPVAVIVLCVTLVGMPLGLALAAVLVFFVYLASIVVASAIGRRIFGATAGLNPRYALALVAGLVILGVLESLPYVGWLASVLAVPTGLGMCWLAMRPLWARA